MGPGRARDASKSSRIFAAPRKTSQPPPGRPQGGPQASPGMPQGSPGVLFAWIFDSILMSICIEDKTRPGGVRGAFEYSYIYIYIVVVVVVIVVVVVELN